MEEQIMDNNNELNADKLEKVTGGQYDPDVEYSKAQTISAGNLYSPDNIRLVVGKIQPGQDIEVHPNFEYQIDGKVLCVVRINGTDYLTERENIA